MLVQCTKCGWKGTIRKRQYQRLANIRCTRPINSPQRRDHTVHTTLCTGRLKMIRTKRPLRERLLKDIEPFELLVACDHWEESGESCLDWETVQGGAAYLCYATTDQTTALTNRLPHKIILVPSPKIGSTLLNYAISRITDLNTKGEACFIKTVLPTKIIQHILTFLGITKPEKYYRVLKEVLTNYEAKTTPHPPPGQGTVLPEAGRLPQDRS